MDSEKPLAIDPSDLLGPSGGPTILGQRKIYVVSASEEYRLALLDELIGEEARTRANAVQEAIERLRTNGHTILEVRGRLTKRDEYQQRLKAVEHEIEVYERHGAAEKFRDATQLRSDGQQLRGTTETVRNVHQDWSERCHYLLAPLETAHRSLLRGKSQQKAILEQAAQIVERLRHGLASALEQAESLLKEAESTLKELGAHWQTTIRPLEEEINHIKQETQTEALDPDRLLRLAEERTALTPLIEELDRGEIQLKELQEGRLVLLAEVRDCRLAEHQLRRERAEAIERLLQSRIRLEVEFKGQKHDYKDRLAALLRGSGVSQDALDQLTAPEATDGIALGEAIQSGIEEMRRRFGLTPAMADRLVKWLTAEESRLFDLETPIPPDALRVDLLDRYLEATGQEELKSNRERLLMNWGLLSGGHPTIAGIILFGREPQRHLPFAQINAARFPGTESSVEPSDRKDLTGRLLDVIDQAERFLDLHLRIPHSIHGFEPEPRPELPKEAWREAIVNAVAHRDYTVRGPVRLFIFDYRIEVHTPGRPPNTVDEEAIRVGVHVVRNPRISTQLSDVGLVTRAGTEVRRIIRLVREATRKDIGITIRAFEVLLTIPRRGPVS